MIASPPLTATSLAPVVAQFERGSMLEHLVTVAGKLASPVVFVDPDVATLTLGTVIVDDGWLARRMAQLAHGVSGSRALARAAMARAGALWIERGVGRDGISGEGLAGTFATLAIAGPATLDDDLAVARAIGIAPDAASALGARLRALGDHGEMRPREVRVTVYAGQEPDGMAVELGFDTVRVGTAPLPDTTVGHPDLSLDDAIHAVTAIAKRPDHAARLRAIAATLGRARVDVELAPAWARIAIR